MLELSVQLILSGIKMQIVCMRCLVFTPLQKKKNWLTDLRYFMFYVGTYNSLLQVDIGFQPKYDRHDIPHRSILHTLLYTRAAAQYLILKKEDWSC